MSRIIITNAKKLVLNQGESFMRSNGIATQSFGFDYCAALSADQPCTVNRFNRPGFDIQAGDIVSHNNIALVGGLKVYKLISAIGESTATSWTVRIGDAGVVSTIEGICEIFN